MARADASSAAHAVCPFCSLLCDDLVVRVHGRGLRVERNGCAKANIGFADTDGPAQPHAKGRPVALDAATRAAADILRAARQPLIAGMAADVTGCRAAMALAEQCGAAVDHVHGEAAMQNLRVLQSKGWFLTTLAELKNRADVLLLVGTNAVDQFPRFFERFVWNQESLTGLPRNRRTVIYLGNPKDVSAGVSPEGRRPTVVRCREADLAATVATLRSLLRGAKPRREGAFAPARVAALQKLCTVLQGARYGVIVWSPGELGAHADLVVRALSELITDLNTSTRFAGLTLVGNDGGMSCQNVAAWQSGFPMRVNYASGAPDYDPDLHGTPAMVRHRAMDAMLWLNSLDASLQPPPCNAPLLAVARPSYRLARNAEIFIPVATPGLDHAGTVFRTDSVVSLPLRPLRPSTLPSAAEVLAAIARAL